MEIMGLVHVYSEQYFIYDPINVIKHASNMQNDREIIQV